MKLKGGCPIYHPIISVPPMWEFSPGIEECEEEGEEIESIDEEDEEFD